MINNIYCIGRNYAEHARELGNNPEEKPLVFSKPNTALITGPEIILPGFSTEIHYETEIVVRIATACYQVSEADAGQYYDAITVGLDLTARDLQSELKAKQLPWLLSKGFKGSCYLAKFMDKGQLANDIYFGLELNGYRVQTGNTRQMIFSINRIISFISQFIEMVPGDVIFTGTPEGVGKLHSGDQLVLTLGNRKMDTLKVR